LSGGRLPRSGPDAPTLRTFVDDTFKPVFPNKNLDGHLETVRGGFSARVFSTRSANGARIKQMTETFPMLPRGLAVAGPRVKVGTVNEAVDLRQVAPTILKALGLKPHDLRAVPLEHTQGLPKARPHDECDDDDDDD